MIEKIKQQIKELNTYFVEDGVMTPVDTYINIIGVVNIESVYEILDKYKDIDKYKNAWEEIKTKLINELRGVEMFDSDFFSLMLELEQKHSIEVKK